MTTVNLKHLIAILTVAAVSGTATAGEDAFMKLDRNADGFISAEESIVDKMLYEGWASVDANNDGRIDAAEFSAFELSTEKAGQKE
ncbi:MAG: hypothetical protein B6D72_14055 [gamma proteobacterium symbiont of Ctena orbiculata]|uniref:EF-hand domain-containing protein n=1 Tax=Candidatus Thiodiazotropha taylori TaxID=2792791 RepID=A0A944MCP7_9GAMM|nr:EF-hand domain-containing protein [Candidatus Thiodiazotropha taylori]PUB89568.1 MAG: calmodulin [gamma proteobacterium symbiont of Ctena orbiculata]MBT2989498.1 EF-hand domain-containing protein [Candidatus Thiodiazotropha taylori]MBT2997078.1 EF-hand domain-containing protein [Candidatus Thiodiazotropha taylori]MBT3001232.1 EF-hand domain-containing protein [Candidatus Thiodiazotropha taylori]